MKPTEQLALISFGVGTFFAGLFYWHVDADAPWWLYAIIAALVGSGVYQTLLDQISKERIVDRDHTPR